MDVVGAFAGPQPDAHWHPAADSPPGRHLPQVGARRGEASQPLEDRGSDELFVGGRRRNEIARAAVQKPRVEPTGDHVGIGQQEADELDIGDHPEHRGVGQGPIEGSQRGRPIRAVRDDLRQHGVVVAADDHSRGQTRIDSHARRVGFHHHQHIPAGGQETTRRILGVDPRFNRVALQRNIGLTGGQLLPRRDPDLPFDKIPSRHQLGDRVLDL